MSPDRHVNQAVVVDTSTSPFARLKPVPMTAVILEDEFWRLRQRINQEVMLPAQYDLCVRTGRIDNFRRAAGKVQGVYQGAYYNDSDVYKLLESAAWALSGAPNPELEALVDALIEDISSAQQPDGYLNTYFMFERESERWTNFDMHEMYSGGHLIQAAVAHYRVTGQTRLLDVAIRFADHVCDRFGREEDGKRFGNDGHPEIEMALVELYRVTGNRRYLEQTQYFIDHRGYGRINNGPYGRFPIAYHQDHMPFREMTHLTGHAVRAVYLNCGAADVVLESDDPELRSALQTMWNNMTSRQIYIHGGLGPRHENEGFGIDYELPNHRGHAETCASVANFMWNWRMLLLSGESRYADLMETTLYNGILSGVSLDGRAYFYQNPLSDDGHHRRQEWFSTACCPGNLSRTLSTLPAYLYSTSEDAIWVHLYASNTATLELSESKTVTLVQRTDYPWSGDVNIQTRTAGTYSLYLRIPGWAASDWTLTINGDTAVHEVTREGYVRITREWQVNDTVEFHLPMPVRYVESHPLIAENHDRVAVMRGPMLYCIEGADYPHEDVRLFTLGASESFSAEFAPDLLRGVTVLHGSAAISASDENWETNLYRPQAETSASETSRNIDVTAIPYYAWANRTPEPMQVWIRTQ